MADSETPNGDAAEEFINSTKQEQNFTEEELQRNKELVERLKKIIETVATLDKEADLIFEETEEEVQDQQLVRIYHAYDQTEEIDDLFYQYAPSNFTPPFFCIDVYRQDSLKETLNTHYGKIPRLFEAADEKLYYAENIFYFNSEGKVYRYEEIEEAGPELTEENLKENSGRIKKLNFVPNLPSRHSKLDESDYETINYGLNAIETQKVKFNPNNSLPKVS